MPAIFCESRRTGVIGLLIGLLVLAGAGSARGQVEWVKDASVLSIPTGSVSGRINGKSATLTSGKIRESGKIGLGDELEFPQYIIYLADAPTAFESKFDVQITVTVRKGELPDGKVFRANFAPSIDQRSGLRGEGYWFPDLYSVMMHSRKGAEFGSGTDFVSSSASQNFTGRVELDNRKGEKIGARLYICYNDEQKSCIAGNIDLSIE